MPNIWTEQYQFTAEDYAHWFLFIAPFVLKDRLPSRTFYSHFMLFHSILRTTLQYSITKEELNLLRANIIIYVQQYEK